MQSIKSRIVDRNTRRVLFESVSSEPVSNAQLAQEQTTLGYDPYGYGCSITPNALRREGENYVYSWTCSGSCD